MPIQVEDRRQIGLEKSHAYPVQSRRGFEAGAHWRATPATKECFRAGLPALARSLASTPAIGCGCSTTPLPVHQIQSLTLQQDFQSFARH
jgi:hypothetical protein